MEKIVITVLNAETVSVVIVSHNSGKVLPDCLNSISGSDYPLTELIVVDNASTDGSIEDLEKRFPSIRVIQNRGNLGYSRAANKGLLASSSNLVVLINPDTVVEKSWLKELVQATTRHPRSAFFQPKIMLLNKPGFINSAGNMIHIAGFGICRGLGEIDHGQYEPERDVSFASGACVLARRNALHEIGLCDELFFMYMDDLDWGWRGKMFGWESTYVPSSIVYHAWSEISRISSKFYHLESGRIIALAKNVTFRSVLVLSPILIICEMAVLINASLNGWLREKIQSYAHLLKIMNLVLKRRKRLMQQRNVSDRLILRNFVTEMRHPYIGTAGIGLGKVSNLLFRLLRTLL